MPKKTKFQLLKLVMVSSPINSKYGYFINRTAPPTKGKGYKAYLHGLKQISRGVNIPLVAHISLTDSCDNSCEICSSNKSSKILSLAEIKIIINKFKKAGTSLIAFTGGEPALRDDLEEIISFCSGEDISPFLFTSCSNLSKERIFNLVSVGLESVYISLDSHIENEHNRIRNNEKSYSDTINALMYFKETGCHTAIHRVTDNTFFDVDERNEFLKFVDGLEIEELMLLDPVPINSKQGDFISEDKKKILMDMHIASTKNKKGTKISSMALLESAKFMGCRAGHGFVYINTAGDVYPCDFAPIYFGNLFNENIEDILKRLNKYLISPSKVCLAKHLIENNLLQGSSKSYEVLENYTPGKSPDICL
ncbi:radical SAM/SPASM domain-containing protein [Bacteroidota bacterium]